MYAPSFSESAAIQFELSVLSLFPFFFSIWHISTTANVRVTLFYFVL